jgi:hypothetical protein
MRNIIKAFVLSATLAVASINLNAQNSGAYIRVGAGYYADINVGAGYMFRNGLSLGAEATTWSMFCGIGGALDARYRFTPKDFSPFVDVKLGYGLLGVDYEYENYYNCFTSAMAGISWRRWDLGAGIAYDRFYKSYPVVNLSYTFLLGKK